MPQNHEHILPFSSSKNRHVVFLSNPTVIEEPPHLAEALRQARISTASLDRVRQQLNKLYHEILFAPILSIEHRQNIYLSRFE